jgi:hypothetical protein
MSSPYSIPRLLMEPPKKEIHRGVAEDAEERGKRGK